MGTIHLSHSLAHALPPPGYNKRPHCMVLTVANRGVYFFQAGTEELVNEWVSTCNYWAARTSKEPLAGGVSNMEYGWNKVVDIYGHGRSRSQSDLSGEPEILDSVSVRSGKSTRSKYGWRDGTTTMRGPYSPRVDKPFINDWKPPLPPTVSSVHDEETQLDALRKHVASLKKDLETHNELREPMSKLVSFVCDDRSSGIANDTCAVSTTVGSCHESPKQLGRKVSVFASRDRQIRSVYRFSTDSYVIASEEARRKRSVVHFFFLLLLIIENILKL